MHKNDRLFRILSVTSASEWSVLLRHIIGRVLRRDGEGPAFYIATFEKPLEGGEVPPDDEKTLLETLPSGDPYDGSELLTLQTDQESDMERQPDSIHMVRVDRLMRGGV